MTGPPGLCRQPPWSDTAERGCFIAKSVAKENQQQPFGIGLGKVPSVVLNSSWSEVISLVSCVGVAGAAVLFLPESLRQPGSPGITAIPVQTCWWLCAEAVAVCFDATCTCEYQGE